MDDHKLPPNETDQVQPIDRGLGRQVKIYMGQEMDEWLDDDKNLECGKVGRQRAVRLGPPCASRVLVHECSAAGP